MWSFPPGGNGLSKPPCLQQAGGFLGLHFRPACSRQAPLYHPALTGTPPEEGNWNHLGGLFPTCLPQAGAALPPSSMQAYISVGVSINDGGGVIPAPPPFRPPLSFQRKLESRRAGRGVRRIARLTLAGMTHVVIPAGREWMIKTTGFRLSPE